MGKKTVADIRALKGVRKLTMLFVRTIEEASAAHEAGIDMICVPINLWTSDMREAAGECFVQVGIPLYHGIVTLDEHQRAAHRAMQTGGDSVYCVSSIGTIKALADDGIPVVGHAGLIPQKSTWTGGFKAVGKTTVSAIKVFEDVKKLEAAGCFGVEIEVVPDRVAAEIAKRSKLVLLGMGAGPHADAQYLFSDDVLGCTQGHKPRHAKTYRNFTQEYQRLQQERVAAFQEFRADVEKHIYPGQQHIVPIDDTELEGFLQHLIDIE
tara:strand:- start:480 stop:1277 length:798 start_codon:yes stop_codon:yes gene_type:complete